MPLRSSDFLLEGEKPEESTLLDSSPNNPSLTSQLNTVHYALELLQEQQKRPQREHTFSTENITTRQLADAMGISQAAIIRRARHLVARGWLEQRDSPGTWSITEVDAEIIRKNPSNFGPFSTAQINSSPSSSSSEPFIPQSDNSSQGVQTTHPASTLKRFSKNILDFRASIDRATSWDRAFPIAKTLRQVHSEENVPNIQTVPDNGSPKDRYRNYQSSRRLLDTIVKAQRITQGDEAAKPILDYYSDGDLIYRASLVSSEKLNWEEAIHGLVDFVADLCACLVNILEGSTDEEVKTRIKILEENFIQLLSLCDAINFSKLKSDFASAICTIDIAISLKESWSEVRGSIMHMIQMPSADHLMELDKKILVGIILRMARQIIKLSRDYDPVQEINAGSTITMVAKDVGVSREAIRKLVERLTKDGWLLRHPGGKRFFEAYEVEIIKRKPGCCGPFLLHNKVN